MKYYLIFQQIIDSACEEGRRQGSATAALKFTTASGATIVSLLDLQIATNLSNLSKISNYITKSFISLVRTKATNVYEM